VQMVQYSGTNKTPPVTTLKSLHDPYDDNLSIGSIRYFISFSSNQSTKHPSIFLSVQLAACSATAHLK
jgi:hypothetical protein